MPRPNVAQERRRTWADVKRRRYVRPDGASGQHVVEERPGGTRIIVTGPAGTTYPPGSTVLTGNRSGRQGEVILTPPPGARGNLPPLVQQVILPAPVFELISPNFLQIGNPDTSDYALVGQGFIGAELRIEEFGTGNLLDIPTFSYQYVVNTDISITLSVNNQSAFPTSDLRLTKAGFNDIFISGWIYSLD